MKLNNIKLKQGLKKQIFLTATLGLISSVALSACAPNYNNLGRSQTNSTSNNSSSNKNNDSLDAFLTTNNETKLDFSTNFYQTTKFQKSSDIDSRFQGFDSDLNPEYILNAPKYKTIITSLNQQQIRNDILDNLKYLVLNDSKIKIDFTNLKLDFDLGKYGDNLLIKNFKLVFNLYNQHNRLFTLFNNVMIPARALTQVVIQFNQAHINPNLKKNNASDGKIDQFFSAWTVDSNDNNISAKLNNLKIVFGDNKNKTLQTDSTQSHLSLVEQSCNHLDFIFTRSFALNTYYTRLTTGFDLTKLNQETTKNISNLTSEEIKADLNHSEINLNKIYYVNLIKDAYNILKYFSIRNVSQNDGKVYSLIDLIYNETTLAGRKKLLSGFGIPLTVINLIAAIFDNNNRPELKDIYDFIETLIEQDLPSFICKHLKIRLDWIKEPEIDNSIPNQPKLSLKYIKTVEFDHDLTIELNTKNPVNKSTDETDNNSKPKRKYDVSKLLNLKAILSVFGLNANDNSNPLSKIIGSIATNLDLNRLHIPKNTKISTTYEVNDGNLSLYMAKTFDHKIAHNYTLGWQVDQVHSSTDLSGLYQFLIPFFSKLNAVQTSIDNTDIFSASKILSLVNKVKQFDLNALFEILTYFYVPYKQTSKYRRNKTKNWITKEGLTEEDIKNRIERPVEKFLRLFLTKKFEFFNSHITALVSNAFYDLPKTINHQPLYAKNNLSTKDNLTVTGLDQNQTIKTRTKRAVINQINNQLATTTTLANSNDTISSSYVSNDDLNLHQLITSAKPGILLNTNSNKSNSNQTNLQLIWKLSDQKSLADNYQNFYSKTTATIKGAACNHQYDQIIKNINNDNDVIDTTKNQTKLDLLDKFKTVAIDNYTNPLNPHLKPYVSIFKLPLFSVFNEILQGDFAQKHTLELSKSVKNTLKGLINTVVSLNPYLVSTKYPLNPDQIGVLKNNKYSTELEDRQTSVTKFIAPKTNFSKVKFPSTCTIIDETITDAFTKYLAKASYGCK
ncbi:hypothetical protein MCAV_04610 [[Mycoplasma] cavipharyngis]|uniref:hypothetical protein n=1 Tax=[Mycoplasma] cavipharyngis TaxID=92757 RepID=UPI003704BC61